jgi:hypothetical protein
VLTNDAESSLTGQSITFNGNPVLGTKMGTDPASPCFPQAHTIPWKADVTARVASPGNGVYNISGFPGGNLLLGNSFTEGVTLQVLWTLEGAPVRSVVSYEAPAGAGNLFVSPSDDTILAQTLSGFQPATAPISARLYEVIGNGQLPNTPGNGGEVIQAFGGGGGVILDDTLDGSTSAIAPQTCSYTDTPGLTDCFWDDDTHNVSAALIPGNTSLLFLYQTTADCHDVPALAVSVRTDLQFDYCAEGGRAVDLACPEAAPVGGQKWKNHGEYLSCVAAAADAYMLANGPSGTGLECSTSCIVNPRARSGGGKK